MIGIISNKYMHNTKTHDILLAGLSSGGTGEILHDKEITGHPYADLAIKILVPIITGCIFPLLKDYIALLVARIKKDEKNIKDKKK